MSKQIPVQQAIEMTSLYRKEKGNVLADFFKNKDILAICETFDRSNFEALLSEQNCVAIRIYYGMDNDLKIHAILVGVNDKGEDILPASQTQTLIAADVTDGGDVYEEGTRCPPICPTDSPLNGG